MASMSKNPFVNPPNSRNPFINHSSRPSMSGGAAGSSSSTSPPQQQMSVASIPKYDLQSFNNANSNPIPVFSSTSMMDLPPLPPSPQPPRTPSPTNIEGLSPPISPSQTHYDPQAYMRSSEAEDLDAAIQASFSEAYPPPPGAPPPLPSRRPTEITRHSTGALNSSVSGNARPPPLPSRRPTRSQSSELGLTHVRSRSDSPPPYSAAPDVRAGERTMETGPARPFQQVRATPGVFPPSGFFPTARSNSQPDLPGAFFTAPLGLPPSGRTGNATGSASASASGSRNSAGGGTTDESPTTVPTPGRPLLNDGNTLVYPHGFECWKCFNTGWKHYDPSHPCRKCWSRYAKPFAGPLVYAPWSNRPSNSNYQQPLPKTRGPTLTSLTSLLTQQHSSPNVLTRSTSNTNSRRYEPGELYRNGSNGPWVQTVSGRRGERLPSGSVVVQPGDPRIGGRLCWHCGGDGTISLFLFDRERCPTCNGMGRILT